MNKSSLEIYIRTILGIVFILSGFAKALDCNYFANILTSYGVEWFYHLAPLIVFAELLFGIALLFGICSNLFAYAGILLVFIFTITYLYGFIFIDVRDCGCFGRIKVFDASPIITFLRNLLLIAGLWFVGKERKERFDRHIFLLLTACAILMFSGAFICGNTFRRPTQDYNIDAFKPMALDDHILREFVQIDRDSSYLVTIFSYTCPHCINSIGNIEQYESFGIVDAVIGICADNPQAEILFKKKFKPSFRIKNYPMEQLAELSYEFPVSYIIRNDSIVGFIPGEVPSAFFFEPVRLGD